jgi:tetratricopeptide (TPR) repeat protein
MQNSIAPYHHTASPTFSVIAERFRRAGQFDRAVALCREGLAEYPDHLSARVTLGIALLELKRDIEAHRELQLVIKRAPDNLAAIRGLAELHARGVEEQDARDGQDWQDMHDLQVAMAEPAVDGAKSEAVVASDPSPIFASEPAAIFAPEPVALVATEPAPPIEEPVRFEAAVVTGHVASPPLALHDCDLSSLDELDPVVEVPAPMHFEIEDVIHEADDAIDLGFAAEGFEDIDPVFTPEAIEASETGGQACGDVAPPAGPMVVLDEWLSRIRARRAELLSEYAAS